MFVNPEFQDFTLLWSPILIQLLLPLLTGSDKFGWEHVADNSASPTCGSLLVLLSAQSSCVWGWLLLCCAQWDYPLINNKNCVYVNEEKSSLLFMLVGFFIFQLLVFCEFLGPDSGYMLKLGSDVHDSLFLIVISIPINHEYWESTVF